MPRVDEITPLETAANGRDARGRFGKGNKAGQGNPTARKVARFRARLFNSITDKAFRALVASVLREAESGEGWACKLLFAYLLGEPQAVDVLQELEALREKLRSLEGEQE